MIKRHDNAQRTMQSRQRVADRYAGAHRHPARFGRQVAQSAHGFADHAETGTVAVRPGLPVARHSQHDQPGIKRGELFPAHAPLFHRARTEIFDQHVGLGDQLAREILPFLRPQVDGDGALVARLHLPPD